MWPRLKEFPERALHIERWIKCRIASSLSLFVALPVEWTRCCALEARDYAARRCRASTRVRLRVRREITPQPEIYFT